MKKFKLSTVFLLVFVLLIGLVGCSSGEEASTEPEEETTEETTTTEEEAVDLGGRALKFANHWDMTPEGGTEYGDLTVEYFEKVQEKYNVSVEYVVVPFEEKVNQLTTSILAGEPFADLVSLDSTQAAQLIQQDYLIPLDDILDLNTIKMSDAQKQMYTIDGKVYMFGHQLNQSGGMYYNKTMFEQAGLPDPYELQQKGEWTWEAMLEAAKKLTTGDTYGLSADPNLLMEYLIATNDAYVLNPETYEVELDSENAMEALEFMYALYNEHKVIKPNEGNNWEDPRNYFTEGVVGMTQGWVWEAEGRADTPFEWGYVFWPKGPKADDYVTPTSSVEGFTIPVGVEDPEIVYRIWEEMQVWEMAESSVIEWFETVLPSEETIDTATQMLTKVKTDFWKAYNLEDAFYEMNDNIARGVETPAQAVAKVLEQAQARVDDFLNK